MRMVIAAFVFGLAVATAGPVKAETHTESLPAEAHPYSITLDIGSIGGSVLGLVMASGIVNLFNAASLMSQGAPILEAMESGAGLPLPITALAIILGAVFGKDIVNNAIIPAFGASAHAAPAHGAPEHASPAH